MVVLGIWFQGFVQIVHIGFHMLVVVKMHGFLVDVWLQGVVGVGQRGKFKGIRLG